MAMQSLDDEFDRAISKQPFANGFEGDSWTAAWCYSCKLESTCPLIMIAVLGRTPVQWEEVNPGGLSDRYRCSEYDEVK